MKPKNAALVFILLFALSLLSRFTSHAWNLTILGGVAFFAGSFFEKKSLSLALVLISLFVSDFVIGFYPQMAWVYAAYLGMMALGYLVKPQDNRFKIYGFSLAASLVFFFVSNFSVWLEGLMYPQTITGLVDCYVMGLPFFKNQVIGDILSVAVFFEISRQLLPNLVAEKIKTAPRLK